VSQALNAEINTLAYPGAALLCFCLALEIAEARLGMEITIDEAYWKQCAESSLPQFISWVKSIAHDANLRRYRKHRRGPKRPPPKRASGKRRPHVSTHRILEVSTRVITATHPHAVNSLRTSMDDPRHANGTLP